MTPSELASLIDISREEAEALFDERARRYLGMSGEDFLRLVEAGEELPDHPMVGHLLLMLGAQPRSH